MNRRRLLPFAAVAFVPGCLSSPDGLGDSTPEPEARDAESYLPEAGDGWTLAETYEPGLGETGLTDAVVGKYRSPDDRALELLARSPELTGSEVEASCIPC